MMSVRYKKKSKRLQFADEDEERQEDVSPLVSEDELHSASAGTEQSSETSKEKKGKTRMCSCVNSWKTIAIAVVAFALAVTISAFISKFVGKSHTSSGPITSQISPAAVATDVPICTAMGADILKNQGSAVDAAITTMLCVGVVNSQSSGIGGGAFMVIHDKGKIYSLNFRETAPAAASQGMYRSNASWSTLGALAVAVPGELRGMEEAHKRFGRLSWSALFKPVIDMCRNGFPMTAHTVGALKSTLQSFRNLPVINSTYFYPNGSIKKEGDTLYRPDFADTLELIAGQGADVFYNGTLGREMVTELQQQGGNITLDDLLHYRAVWEQPVCMLIGDGRYNMCAPGVPSGGPVLLFALKVLDNFGMTPTSAYQNLTYHRIAETFKYAFAMRSYLGDPYCPNCTSANILAMQKKLLNATFATFIRNSIDDSRTYNYTHYHGSYVGEDQGTSHISVLGSDGQAVSVTSTINTRFGSKVVTKSGIVLNNEMDDFSSPNVTNFYNVEPSEANFILPYKRPLSSMCPTIVVDTVTGNVSFVVGASGGTRILTATAFVTLRALLFQQSVADAIEARRLHHQLLPEPLDLEMGFPSDIMAYLQGKGFTFDSSGSIAVVQGIMRNSMGNVTAHSDSRKQGWATVL